MAATKDIDIEKHYDKVIADLKEFLIEKLEHLRTEVKDEKDSARLARELAIDALDKHLLALNNATEKERLAKDTFANRAVFELEMKGIHKDIVDLQTSKEVADAIVQTKASQLALIISFVISAISILFSALNYLAK